MKIEVFKIIDLVQLLIDGYYERGCDYSANLCALSLYSNENPFCEIITKLNANLNNIDNIL